MPAASDRRVNEVTRRTQERAARGLHTVTRVFGRPRLFPRSWLVLAASGALTLAGCSNPSMDPVDWWHDLEGGPLAETRPPPPNADAPYPNLGQVPPKPAPLDPARRNAISAGLVADRANAQYTASLSPLQVAPPHAIAAPPPLPSNAADSDQTSNATLVAANAPPRIAPLGPPQPPLPNTTVNPPRPAPVGTVTSAPLPPLVAQPAAPPASAGDAAPASATPPTPLAAAPASVADAAPPASPPNPSPSGPAVPLSSAPVAPSRPAPTPLASPAPGTNPNATAAARPATPPRPVPVPATAPTALAAAAPAAPPPAPPAPPSQAASGLLAGMPEQPPPMVQLSGSSLPTRVAPTPAPTPPAPPPAPAAPPPQPGAPVTIAFTPGSAVLPTTALAPLKMLAQRHGAAAIAVTGYGEAASADPATLPAALQLALARARSIAGNLLAAGVPSSSIRIATQARGNGGAAQIVNN